MRVIFDVNLAPRIPPRCWSTTREDVVRSRRTASCRLSEKRQQRRLESLRCSMAAVRARESCSTTLTPHVRRV